MCCNKDKLVLLEETLIFILKTNRNISTTEKKKNYNLFQKEILQMKLNSQNDIFKLDVAYVQPPHFNSH